MNKAIIDLGCGPNKVQGAIGVDRVALPGVDVVHDLEITPYPFPDNKFDEAHIYHVLEHMYEPMGCTPSFRKT